MMHKKGMHVEIYEAYQRTGSWYCLYNSADHAYGYCLVSIERIPSCALLLIQFSLAENEEIHENCGDFESQREHN
jgi:hypothetical protein